MLRLDASAGGELKSLFAPGTDAAIVAAGLCAEPTVTMLKDGEVSVPLWAGDTESVSDLVGVTELWFELLSSPEL